MYYLACVGYGGYHQINTDLLPPLSNSLCVRASWLSDSFYSELSREIYYELCCMRSRTRMPSRSHIGLIKVFSFVARNI